MLFNCNYNVKDLNISCLFYTELLKWWCEFCEDNAADNNWHYFIWNNQEIRIINKPVFYKRYHNYGIQTVSDLRFDLNNIDSYELIAKNIERTNFLEWTGLRNSSLRIQPPLIAPGRFGISRERRLRFTAKRSILMTLTAN